MTPEEIKKHILRALSRAANFKRVDLQVHSDESDDFPRPTHFGDTTFTPGELDIGPVPPATFLQAAAEKHLDLIAITDHMKSRKSCEVAAASLSSAHGVVALPAIEVNVSLAQTSSSTQDAVHLLCIFREGKSPEDIEQIFQGAHNLKDYDKRSASDVLNVDMKEFVANVHRAEGICIASHVNSEKGLRRAFFTISEINYLLVKRDIKALESQKNREHRTAEEESALQGLRTQEKTLADQVQNNYLQFLVDCGVDAVQIQNSTEGQFYRGEHCETLGIRPIPAILTTDAHCISAIGFERKITFVKMTRPSWQDLSMALKDPEVRIKYADTLGLQAHAKIKGIAFITTDGFFRNLNQANTEAPQVIGFADNLTCFIGGRGAGKSAAIDALRFMFKDKGDVEALPANLKSDIYGRLDHTLRDTTIFIHLEAEDGEEIVAKSFYSGWGERRCESWFLSGDDAGVDLTTSAKYRAEIYGWNEIETLGTDSRKQLGLLDRFIQPLRAITESIRERRNELRTNRTNILDKARRLEQLVPTVKDFEEVKNSYEKINTPQMQAAFSELDNLLEREKALEVAAEDIEALRSDAPSSQDLRAKFNEISSRLTNETLRERVFGPHSVRIEEAVAAHARLSQLLLEMKAGLDVAAEELKQEKAAASERLSTIAGSDVKSVSTLEKRAARKARYEELLAHKEMVRKQRDALQIDLEAREGLLAEYERLQLKRSNARAATKDEINSRLSEAIKHGPQIAISFYALGERGEFETRLGAANPGAQGQKESGVLKNVGLKYMDRRIAEIISSKFTPIKFVASILQGKHNDFAGTHPDGKDNITDDESRKIYEHLDPRSRDYGEDYYAVGKLSALLELQEIEVDDRPEITLDGMQITNLSPGQRCSALIPIILLQGNHPLIIDQPEDNLDNRLVFDLVVEILRNLKESRQIIVATHNPNIPVSGDAEQIVVFESVDRRTGRIAVQGSIDDSDVIKSVKDIMEGGDEAFLIRAKKYRYELSA